MKSKEALEKIKNIELHHTEYFDDDDYYYGDADSIDSYEENDGTIEENYHDEIQVIEKDLEVLEFLKSHLDIEIEEDTLYIEGGAITITPLSPEEELLFIKWLKR